MLHLRRASSSLLKPEKGVEGSHWRASHFFCSILRYALLEGNAAEFARNASSPLTARYAGSAIASEKRERENLKFYIPNRAVFDRGSVRFRFVLFRFVLLVAPFAGYPSITTRTWLARSMSHCRTVHHRGRAGPAHLTVLRTTGKCT